MEILNFRHIILIGIEILVVSHLSILRMSKYTLVRYVGDDKRSYLFLSDIEPCAYLPLDEFSFISEYGTTENEEATRSYVSEHAKEICKSRAVEELARFLKYMD